MTGFTTGYSKGYTSFGGPFVPLGDPSRIPLGPIGTRSTFSGEVETNDLKEHYIIASGGLYGKREYADISLLRRKQT